MPCKTAVLMTLLAAAAPLAAQDCPATLEDAAKGVAVSYSDGSTSVFILDIASGVVTEDWTLVDQPTLRNTLDNGLHLVQAFEVDETGQSDGVASFAYRFETPPPALTKPGQIWDVGYDMVTPFGAFNGSYTGKVGAEENLQIGTCAYPAFPVTMTMVEPDVTTFVKVDFVPGLGFSILRGFGVSLQAFTALMPVSIAKTAQP